MITKLSQNLLAGDVYNLSQWGYDVMTVSKVKHSESERVVVLDGVRQKDGSAVSVTVPAHIEIFQ